MTRFQVWPAALLTAVSLAGSATADRKPDVARKPRVEVVFCLDTTGSMGGLIEAAKQKIWAISSQIAGGKPTPDLKVGLVAYRDRGDQYVTNVHDLTDDLDGVYAKLREFNANGGGDGPESVNQALHDAVHKVKWGDGKDVLRIIFLVGDAPPHMDYADDVKYPATCEAAAKRGIIINTIQCGMAADTQKVWQEICARAEGSYVQIAQDGGAVAVATPFDKRLAEINGELTTTTLVYGKREERERGESLKRASLGLAPAAAADRAGFACKTERCAAFDLLDCINTGKVKLEDVKPDELPAELQKLTPPERKEYLAKVQAKRDGLNKEARGLDKQRADFIAKKLNELKGKNKDAFDGQVLTMLRKQAGRCGIEY
jgi:Mg-chelatase subunit ChlD